jgi:hypothetical protein
MKNTFKVNFFSFTPKGPQKIAVIEHVMRMTSKNLSSVFEGWITLHNKI